MQKNLSFEVFWASIRQSVRFLRTFENRQKTFFSKKWYKEAFFGYKTRNTFFWQIKFANFWHKLALCSSNGSGDTTFFRFWKITKKRHFFDFDLISWTNEAFHGKIESPFSIYRISRVHRNWKRENWSTGSLAASFWKNFV